MKRRKGFLGEDYCFEDYCLTKCEKYPSIYVGSCDCHKCKNFVSILLNNFIFLAISNEISFIYKFSHILFSFFSFFKPSP